MVGTWGREQHVHAWLLLALFELLSGEDNALDAGMEATEGAMKAAHGSLQACLCQCHDFTSCEEAVAACMCCQALGSHLPEDHGQDCSVLQVHDVLMHWHLRSNGHGDAS